jgi:hypothetical protein
VHLHPTWLFIAGTYIRRLSLVLFPFLQHLDNTLQYPSLLSTNIQNSDPPVAMRFIFTVVGVLTLALPLVKALAVPDSAVQTSSTSGDDTDVTTSGSLIVQVLAEHIDPVVRVMSYADAAQAPTVGWGYTEAGLKGPQVDLYVTGVNVGFRIHPIKSVNLGSGFEAIFFP